MARLQSDFDTLSVDEPTTPTHSSSDADPVLDALQTAMTGYLDLRTSWEQRGDQIEKVSADLRETQNDLESLRRREEATRSQLAATEASLHTTESELERTRGDLDSTRQELNSVRGDLDKTRSDLDQERRDLREARDEVAAKQQALSAERERSHRHRERAQKLADALKDIHRALFTGNVYDLILRACMSISGASRGLYVTSHRGGLSVRVRAAVDVDGYPQSAPSERIRALCARVIESEETLVCNEADRSPNIPPAARPGEDFRNFLAAPSVLLKNLDGVVLVADKIHGDFDEHDVETLLSIGDQAAIAVQNARLERELQHAYLATVSTLADAVEAKDAYTHGHCENVSRLAKLTAEHLGTDQFEMSVVCYAALLHDVGKIGVSDGILNKPGPLLPEERDLMRSHVRIGHDLIVKVPLLQTVAQAVLYHHEWYDGTGYPNGLKGQEIPLASRIVSVVDAYNAMISRRSYKEAYSEEHARGELRRGAGTQFDPNVVEAFLTILDSADVREEDELEQFSLLPGFLHLRRMQEAVN